jgi:hypothetical protein
LKEYFKQHPEEKEILLNDLKKNDTTSRNKLLYKNIDSLPFYVIPTQIMAASPEDIQRCTIGSENLIIGNMSGTLSKERTLAGAI